MFTMVMDATLSAYHEAFLRGYWTNQFEVYLQHPGGVSALLTGEVIARYFVAVINTIIYFLVAVTLFGVTVETSNLPETLCILGLAVAALTGLGLAGASTFSLFNAKREEPNPVQLLMSFAVTLLAGVYFPPAVLPGWLQRAGEWLPQTHALRAARLCLTGQATLGDPRIAQDLAFLVKFTVVALPVGILLFALGIRRAQKEGNLTRWS
jgi:ABC-type multidrug transport system permease subunit